ncbi:NADPH-dependent F420 reductase [Streptomyces mirabilis]|uniref:NADPH-dependent F420 reductase n=1 Tax=Streptomyces mirabilis TaxID=68239 RepID=UPI0021BFD8B1|nr:NAD(P)-binding domain-containing protein [Streptomyces mirabilis]MCT9113545.1 NAD(P)-binding domain-containing protein [Streptomyces mirabilis]
MTQSIGFIGSGMIGGSLARLAVAAGLDVVLSNSRGPETLADLVAELGDQARAATTEEAAKAGDVVVATVPMSAYDKLPVDAPAGKIVIDTMNYYPERDGRIAELDSAEVTSSELLQRHLTGSRLVKTLHNMDHRRLFTRARPAGAPDRSALPVAGDDPAAKAEIVRLLDVLGYDAVDIGTLADSWRCEPGTPVYVWPYLGDRPEGITKEEAQRWFQEAPGEPVSADRVNELVDQAVRGSVGGSFAALPFWG